MNNQDDTRNQKQDLGTRRQPQPQEQTGTKNANKRDKQNQDDRTDGQAGRSDSDRMNRH